MEKKHFKAILILTFLFTLTSPQFLEAQSRKYDINIDDDLITQYQELMSDKRDDYIKLVEHVKLNTPKGTLELLDELLESIKTSQNRDWLERVSAISKLSGVEEKDVILINVLYEALCTTTVVSKYDSNNNLNLFMGRNLDFEFTEYLVKLGYEGYYKREGKLLFIAQGIAGYVGILNGIKIGKFALSLNKRKEEKDVLADLRRVAEGLYSPIYLILDTLIKTESYMEAREFLSNTKITAPCYFTIVGNTKNEGAVITRNSKDLIDIDTLDVDNDKWFLVQTNSDRGTFCPRRNDLEVRLNESREKGQDLSYDVLMGYMSLPRTKNRTTIYSTIQSAMGEGYFSTIYWDKKEEN